MATTQGMSGIDLRAVTGELNSKLPLWIDKVYQFESRTLGIRLNGENHARYLLLVEAGRRAHLVSAFPDAPKNPPQFAMFLRKYISGGKVLAIRQHGLERILTFEIGKGEATYRLIIELFDEGNVILTDEEGKIVKPLRHHRFKDRDIVPGAIYGMSGTDPTGSEENLAAVLAVDDRDLVRALAVACMLGGTYAEYVCRTAGIDKSLPAKEADPKAVYAAIRELLDRVHQSVCPVVSAKSCEPVALTEGAGAESSTGKPYAGYSAALETFYPMTKAEKVKVAAKPKLSEEERIHKYQEAAIKKFDEKIKKNEELVNAIYENYQFVAQVISSLRCGKQTALLAGDRAPPQRDRVCRCQKDRGILPGRGSGQCRYRKDREDLRPRERGAECGPVLRYHKKIQEKERGRPHCDEDGQAKEENRPPRHCAPEKTLVPPVPLVCDKRRCRGAGWP